MNRILTFAEARELEIFPVFIGPQESNEIFEHGFSENGLCGVSEEQMIDFRKLAKRDFQIWGRGKPPIAFVFMPDRVIKFDRRVPLDVFGLLSPVKIIFDPVNTGLTVSIKEKEKIERRIKRKVRKSVFLTYISPNPALFSAEFKRQELLAKGRQLEIFNLPEAVYCRYMINRSEVLDFGFDRISLPMRTANSFNGIPLAFHFATHGLTMFYYLSNANKDATLACGMRVRL